MAFSEIPNPPSGPANDQHADPAPSCGDATALARAQLRAQARAPLNRLDRRLLGRAWQGVDLMVTAVLAAAALYFFASGDLTSLSASALLPLLIFGLLAPSLLKLAGLYQVIPRFVPAYHVLRAISAAGLAGIAAMLSALWLSPDLARPVAIFAISTVAALAVLHTIYAGFIAHWARAGRLARNVVLVGATANARRVITANAGRGTINVVGVFDDRKSRSPTQLAGAPYLGTIEDLFRWSMLPEIDRIFLAVPPRAEKRVAALLERLRALPHPVSLILDVDALEDDDNALDDIVGIQTARMSGREHDIGALALKRLQDVVLGGVLFVMSLPIMLLIAALIRLDSRGPVLFRQMREGFNGRQIEVLKFRTMRHDPVANEKRAVRQVELNDPRVTRIGGFLRKTSLDELPQFWNVLTGDMSLVGPRPHAPGMKTGGTETSSLVAEYAHRHRVKPGITGWAQVNGSRGPLHSPEAARERIGLDVDYIARAGFWFDVWIMMRTLPALLGDKINIR